MNENCTYRNLNVSSTEDTHVSSNNEISPSVYEVDSPGSNKHENNNFLFPPLKNSESYSTPFKRRKHALSIRMSDLSFDDPSLRNTASTPANFIFGSMNELPKPDFLSASGKKRYRKPGEHNAQLDGSMNDSFNHGWALKSPIRKSNLDHSREANYSFHILDPMALYKSIKTASPNRSQNGSHSDPWYLVDRRLVEPLDHYIYGEWLYTLGNGDTGFAVKCREKDGSFYALKQYSKSVNGAHDLGRNIKEAAALSILSHFNIVTYIDSFVKDNNLFIKLEYCDGLNLRDIINNYLNNNIFPLESIIKSFLAQIVGALNYIHNMGIVHYDIKPDNIFTIDFKPYVEMNNNNSADGIPHLIYKIGDFGQCFISGIVNIEISEGDSRYIGRETLEFLEEHLSIDSNSSSVPSPFSDIFALGLTTAEYCGCGDLPSQGCEWQIIRNGNLPPIPNVYSTELINVLVSMIRPEPTERPSAETLMNCPYLNS